MPLTNQKKYKKANTFCAIIVLAILIGLYFYFCIDNTLWLSDLVKQSSGDPGQITFYGTLVKWVFGVALFIANIFLLGKIPKRTQVLITFAELFALLGLFMATFQLSLPFIMSNVGYMITQGAFTTLYVSAISIFIAFCIALVTAIARLSSNGVAVGLATFYTSLFRGLPLLIQIFILYLGLPQLGFIINPIPAGITALSLCYGAYMSEVFRAGIQSIPKGQWEASKALGLHKRKIMRLVILPQALKIIIPPTGNHFIAMLKDSSLVSVVGVWELTYVASTLGNREFRNMEMLVTAAAIYWTMSITLEIIQSRIERKYNPATR
ncbi:MAG: amino acid ABC transporter permease [Candidimonas sp.]|nr:MAG: amino acid ABC transporter permease [Candidimonas sp.]TAM26325.1 MAG: amino acid ABC transporter permease [Candidimonas sp.]TAM75097.1 MAG: amino acid ABC transporter permease [Candidimonas sp.]